MEESLFEDFPFEILLHLLSFLVPSDIHSLSFVSKFWNEVATDQSLWKRLCEDKWNVRGLIGEENWKDVYQEMTVGPSAIHRERAYSPMVKISSDYMSFSYEGPHGLDQAIIANAPFSMPYLSSRAKCLTYNPFITTSYVLPEAFRDDAQSDISYRVSRRSIGYFEIRIKPNTIVTTSSKTRYSCVAIGFCHPDFPLIGSQPGWRKYSYGYHGDDGRVFSNRLIKDLGKPFGVGDVVGAGIDWMTNQIFYTLNGKLIAPVCSMLSVIEEEHLYPVVGCDSSELIEFNFGREPFLFDWEPIPHIYSLAELDKDNLF